MCNLIFDLFVLISHLIYLRGGSPGKIIVVFVEKYIYGYIFFLHGPYKNILLEYTYFLIFYYNI